MIVVDATIWVDLLRGTLPRPLAQQIQVAGCLAPPHVDFEVGAALLRLERRGDLSQGAARELIAAFSVHPVERVRDSGDAIRAIDVIDNATYADAWYIALAKRVESPLMTLDDGMKTAAHIQRVELIET